MPERPLLILPAPTAPARRTKKPGWGGKPHLPSRDRQGTRLTPVFTALQQAFEAQSARMRTVATGLSPEEVIVMETVGPVDDFIVAVRGVPGLEWLGEIEEEDIPPDEDFFVPAADGSTPKDKTLRGRLFLIFTNHQALRQMLSLWETWKTGQALPYGLGKWGDLFSQLKDVRQWGIHDRLEETGVLADWQERVSHNESIINCEIELWFHGNVSRRQSAQNNIVSLVTGLQGQVLHEACIEEISYHALLVSLPIAAVQQILGQTRQSIALVQCEQIQFFRATGQMAGRITDDTRTPDTTTSPTPSSRLGEPVIALLDGLPLQNHHRLAGRLIIDDPDDFEAEYPPAERKHGTAMASLILYGDLNTSEPPLNRKIYVRPILRPDPHDWRGPVRDEIAPENKLLVDLIHRSVRRLFEGEGIEPPVAPHVCVINLSIGIRDRLFDGALSPLARLLDWLAWKYSVLFIVSAGNHIHDIELTVPHGQIGTLSRQQIQEHVIKAVAADARHRRLLSPAEAVNALTIGAVDNDASSPPPGTRMIQPFVDSNLPSCINAQGMGYRRIIKPDILLPGGSVALFEKLNTTPNTVLEVHTQGSSPGQRVACPGAIPGDLSSSLYTRGTSNATALASRVASQLYDVLDEFVNPSDKAIIDGVPRALWLKALLVHASSWGATGSILEKILKTPHNSRQFKEYITRLLGYGIVNANRVSECMPFRVTALGGGQLQVDQAHIHQLPLPPSLSGKQGLKRLVISLAWLTPVNPVHQAWRRAALLFTPPSENPLQLDRKEANYNAVRRGTVQHEILEGNRAAAFVDGDNLKILVSCRADAGTLEEAIPYSLAITLEIAEEIGIDIYNEIRVRVQPTRIDITHNG